MGTHFDKALSDAPLRVDVFNRTKWTAFLRDKKSNLGLVNDSRACFPPVYLECNPIAIWGFDCVRRSLKYFGGEWIGDDLTNDRYADRRKRMNALIEFGILCFNFVKDKPSIDAILNIIEPKRCKFAYSLISTLKQNETSYMLKWKEFGNIVMMGLFPRREGEEAGTKSYLVGQKVIRSINALYDYFCMNGRIWDSCPYDVFDIEKNSISEVTRVFSDPLTFSPGDSGREDIFLWPWQRCLVFRAEAGQPRFVDYTPINTTSLVVDLRGSTTAMGMTADAGRFAEFIDEVVDSARNIILSNTGFFDKDTGDGIVGHFCGTRGGHESVRRDTVGGESIVRAVDAAKDIIDQVSRLCDDYQRHMSHGLGGLRPSVGIHNEEAVWLVNRGQVKAIGRSVVWASRLCATARPAEIVISNGAYNEMISHGGGELASKFHRRSVAIKEYGDSLSPFGYSSMDN